MHIAIVALLLSWTELPVDKKGQAHTASAKEPASAVIGHKEVPGMPWRPPDGAVPRGSMAHCGPWVRGPHQSIQVNVDANGCNIQGDAANEPSMAIDPTDPTRIVIGWRQFDTVISDFRQSGYGYSHDGGAKWQFGGRLAPGIFGTDPVLAADEDGVFYYLSQRDTSELRLFKSFDAGVTWGPAIHVLFVVDKPWLAIDRTRGMGRGHLYIVQNFDGTAHRSLDGGESFTKTLELGFGGFGVGTVATGRDGSLYAYNGLFFRSENARDAGSKVSFQQMATPELVPPGFGGAPNPAGVLGQPWVATGPSVDGDCESLYVLGLGPFGLALARSIDGGASWSEPTLIAEGGLDKWHWFPTLCVAPNGRVDVFWNDTRNSGLPNQSELFYSYSSDGGLTWSPNEPVSPMWDSWIGWPQQNKIGDYYHCVSDAAGAGLAYAATFNGEQDVYFLRVDPFDDCNKNGTADESDVASRQSLDCNSDGVPDECQSDCNVNGVMDDCDLLDESSTDRDQNAVPDDCQPPLYVRADAAGFANGSNWPDAFLDLQDALDLCENPCTRPVEVWVAQGEYKPDRGSGDRTISFELSNGVRVLGGFAGTETDADQRDPFLYETVLSGELIENDPRQVAGRLDQSVHVVSVRNTDRNTVLDGFTITKAYSDTLLEQDVAPGGAITMSSGGLHIHRCVVRDNEAALGGGGIVFDQANLLVTQSWITGNLAPQGGPAISGLSAGLEMADSVVAGNAGPGAIRLRGFPDNAFFRMTNCTLAGNTSTALEIDSVIGKRVTSSVVSGNGTPLGGTLPRSFQMNYSCVDGTAPTRPVGVGNLFETDPGFVDSVGPDGAPGTGDEDYRLRPDSPCANRGDPAREADLDAIDAAGSVRFVGCRVDMGALESEAVQPPGDFEPDSTIDLNDYRWFEMCFRSPQASSVSEAACLCGFDADSDEQITLYDASAFQVAYQGP